MHRFIKSLLIIACLCGQANKLAAKKILIKNESDWNLSIEAEDLGFQLILRPQQAQNISTQKTISIKPYGAVKGALGKTVVGETSVSPVETDAFDSPLILIHTMNEVAPKETGVQQSWLDWTLEKTTDVIGYVAGGAQKITSTRPYTVQIMQAGIYDLPTLHELLSQATNPRYFLKLGKDLKPEEIASANKSLLKDNINALPSGVLKNTLTTLATTALNVLENKRLSAPTAWPNALAQARKSLGKEVACTLVHNKSLSSLNPLLTSNNETQKQTAYKELIVDLMWHLYALAEEKHQAFSEGTFVLVGPAADTVQIFLMNYITMINPQEHGPLSPSSPTAYARISSHFDHSFTHYGIDVGQVLPEDKRHILFGSVEPVLEENFVASQLQEFGGTIKACGKIQGGEETFCELVAPISRFFIKLENYGLSLSDVAGHSIEYLFSINTKMVATYSGKSADDDKSYRKERVPQDFKKRIAALIPNNTLLKKECNELGLQCLFSQVRTKKTQHFDEKTDMALDNYLNELQQEKNNGFLVYDRIGLRFGREVIILEKDLCKQSSLYVLPSPPQSPTPPSPKLSSEKMGESVSSEYFQSLMKKFADEEREKKKKETESKRSEEEHLKKDIAEAKQSSPR
jgi:hypothetical protein